jgi:hypothetical protein
MQTCLLASIAAVVVKGLKITGGRSNLYLRQKYNTNAQSKEERE